MNYDDNNLNKNIMRLADYFVVVEYSTDLLRGGIGRGLISQRFPVKDWEDVPFTSEIELFCQPQGWSLSTERQEPKFFVSVLTHMNGNRHYCACLSFHEPIAITPSKPIDEEEETEGSNDSIGRSFSSPMNTRSSTHHTVMYAPKCLVLMSRLYQIEAFRHCLGTIYTVHSESMGATLEVLVGNLLGHIMVPPAGGPQIRYSLGGGDRLAFQPPVNSSIPVTNSTVAQLFQQLGINNVLVLFCAVMTEQKILFHSKSINRLTDACHALTSLMFPFRYSHVYVPLLPSSITEVACSPTPFIIGVHSSARSECTDMMDVIVTDLDGGSITVPDGISIPFLPESLWSHVQELLSMVLYPELSSADFAFPPLAVKPSIQHQLDKEIRAIFMRMFAQLFQGYRSCLVIIRIHPKPFITFHKAKFLGQRGLVDNEFVVRLLDCMFFNQFILERGSPWRPCDIWDDHYSSLQEQLRIEAQDPKLLMVHIQQLAELLAYNENPNPQPYVPKIIKPPEGAHTRIHAPVFPKLNADYIKRVIQEGMAKQPLNKYNVSAKNQPRIVPVGPKHMDLLDQRQVLVDNSARRLEVLRNCISCIFENKISDAKKSIHAVTRALKSQAAKLVLCEELSQHVTGNKAMLESQQFDMVVKLMHCALQDNSVMDEHGVAAALLPLATSFCRKLCTGVIQFAYTCIQEHPVWKNQQFWESAFYTDVQKDIKSLYIPRVESSLHNNNYSVMNDGRVKDNHVFNKQGEFTALEIAAEQMRMLPNIPGDNNGEEKKYLSYLSEKIKDFVSSEESTLYSQAIHYANRMVYMLVPLDTPSRRHKEVNHIDEERVSNITSMGESDSVGAESGFEEPDPLVESVTSVVRFVSRFVDKVCTEGGVTEEHIRTLHSMIPGVVDMHVETLEAVHRESKRLPPVQKPKIPLPTLLHGEELVMDSLRVYLLPDGREDGTGGSMGGPILLPVEGAIFFTNYRLIFKGAPCDPYASEQVVIRSFPIASLTKEKRITVQYLAHLDQLLQEGLQLRSATFQLLKLAFDEEVSSESIEIFRKFLNKYRHPGDIFSYFAFTGHTLSAPAPLISNKDKNTTLKGFAKKTLMMTAKKAGLKQKHSKRQKYVLHWPQGNGGTLPASTKYLTGAGSPLKQSPPSRENIDGDDVSLSDEEFPHTTLSNLSSQSDSKSIEKIMERSYYKDWKRLGLGSIPKSATNTMGAAYLNKAESFRISFVNATYCVCRSYPALVVVPNLISEESVKKVGRCYRGNRFPVITWKHPRTRALLVRGASFNSKGLMAFLKGNPHAGVGGGGVSEAAAHVEQENFIRAIVNATPLAVVKQGSAWAMSESTLSLDSLYTATTGLGHGHHQHHLHNSHHLNPDSHAALASQITPEIGRKPNPFMKAVNTLRYAGTSGGKGMKTYTGWTVSRPKKSIPAPTQSAVSYKSTPKLPTETELIASDGLTRLHKAALYVFGEKSQIKGIKTEANSKVEYIPVEFSDVRHTRTAFKKLMRACIPSNSVTDPENGFFKSVEATEWPQQLSNIMQLAGAVVDLIDVQGSSVMLCLEDGNDVTTQVASIAQLCLDPYYRTFEGFQTLIEKEWLGFGHRFAHRNNMTGVDRPSSNPGFAPIFLQFLDIVHQILKQFPLAFEFNQYYIKFLAYHSVSARFRTFLVDNEFERVDLGFMALDDKRGSLPRHYKGVDTGSDDESIYMTRQVGSNSHQQHLGQSIFEYIEKQHAKSPIFYNFSYDKDCDIQVLRPMNNLPNLEIWDYFLNENLGTGASFDFETSLVDMHGSEDSVANEAEKDSRRCVMAGYDLVENHIPDAFTYNLQKFHQWETDKCMLPQKWKQVWDKLEVPAYEDGGFTRQASLTTQMVRQLGRSLHKRSTIDILVRGKMVRSTDFSSVYSHSHRFEKHTFTTMTHCDKCSNILLGKSGFKCGECGVKCHEKCSEAVPKCGAKYPKGNPDSIINSSSPHTNSVIENNSTGSSVPSLPSSHQNYQYDQFPSTMPTENRTHEGYLYKRGALLKGWKQRWFVLDSIKHQLRYYDAMEDSNFKGFIELADVDNVTSASPSPGAPKKTDDKSFFDIRTNKRVYNFCASDSSTAQEWIEKIQACLQ